jgi:ABC-type glycerol-3-phosphate transport system substrate-binding protein
VRASSPNAELGWQLVRYMAGPEGQRRLAATGLAQPALRKIAESPAFLDGQAPKNKAMMLEAAAKGVGTPRLSKWTEFNSTLWGPITDPLWVPGTKLKEADVIAALKDADARGDALLFGPAGR